MAAELVMAKLAGAAQATKVAGMTGKSYTVGKVATAGKGLTSWLFLTPTGGVGETVALKLEGARQATELSTMVGKTVTVAKAKGMAGMGVSKWLVLKPMAAKGAVAAGAAAGAAGAAGTAKAVGGGSITMIKLEGARQATMAAGMAGKSFTVLDPITMGQGAGKWLFLQPTAGGSKIMALKMATAGQANGLIGQTITVGKAPMMAGKISTWMVVKPSAGAVAAKAATGGAMMKTAAMVNKGACATMGKTVALVQPAATGTVAKAAAGTGGAMATKTAAAGTIWTGSGLSLGLGLGLGAWGPALLGGAVAAAGYGLYKRSRNKSTAMVEGDALDEMMQDA
ncbi:hypothetical protein JCM17960_12280 [Magnetospira thiophila]